jgi:GNAT superfamily N-acetyltransferase
MPLSLRPAVPADEQFLYQLVYDNMFEQLFAAAWDPQIREPLLKMQIEGQRSGFAAQFPNADHGIILLDDRPVGRIILDHGPEVHWLVDIVIARQHRGGGIGTWILRALCTEADLMRKPIRLQVTVTNPAQRLYHRLGFRLVEDLQITRLMERAPGAAGLVGTAAG